MQIELRRREQRIDIRADAVESDVAEIEQAGEPNHDIQAEGEQGEEDRQIGHAHPRRAGHRQHEGQRQQRAGHQRFTHAGIGSGNKHAAARHLRHRRPV